MLTEARPMVVEVVPFEEDDLSGLVTLRAISRGLMERIRRDDIQIAGLILG